MTDRKDEKKDEKIMRRIGWMMWLNIVEVLLAVILGISLGWIWFALSCLIFVRFTMVQEGTAKLITRFGGVVKIFIQWVGYQLDLEGNVVPIGTGAPTNKTFWGGLRIWLGTPWDKEYEYNLRWHSVEEMQGKKVPQFREKIANYVSLRPDRYWRKSMKMETQDGQFPDIEWLIGLRSINPGKTVFKSPNNWIENALTELEPTLRQFGRTKNLREFLRLSREDIWTEIGNDRAITTVLRDEWGIQVDEKEIGIYDVALPPIYQEALAAESTTEMLAKAAQRKLEIGAEARASETVGTLIAMIHQETGTPIKTIQRAFKKDPKTFIEKHKEIIERNLDLLQRKLAIEGKSFVDIRVQGASGGLEGTIGQLEKAALEFLAVKARMPEGNPPEKDGKESKEKTKKTEEEKDKDEEDGEKRKKGKKMSSEKIRQRVSEIRKKHKL